MIGQILSADVEPKKKLKHIVMAATREQRFERVTKNLKVARVFNTLVEEMKAMGISSADDSECTEVMAPVAHKDRSPVLLLMGGGMGAGKSTVLKDILKELFWAGADVVVIEADAFKESDVIYRALSYKGHVDMIKTAEFEELKSKTIKMAEESKVWNTPGAEKQTKRELFDALRQELEGPVLEKASKSVWDLILEKDGLGKEINETVERVFCHLSGKEPPFYSSSNVENNPMEIEKETEMKDNSNAKTKPKKRSLSEANSSEGTDDVAMTKKKQGDSSVLSLESGKTP